MAEALYRSLRCILERAKLPSTALTFYQAEILRRIAEGATNREIAKELGSTVGAVTASSHIIFNKIGANHRVQAVLHYHGLPIIYTGTYYQDR